MRSSTYASATSRGSGLFVSDMPTSSYEDGCRVSPVDRAWGGHQPDFAGVGAEDEEEGDGGEGGSSGPQSHCWKINRVSTRATSRRDVNSSRTSRCRSAMSAT